ncbi:hypothetical protein ACOMICROBIO_LMKGKHOH_03943 [Vibrio sp. B1FIG11]|uniref:hypothetical protein n=1 Tax=Vibrio sp. B1FIG11 TaxID=2751177 RepID=UPI001AF73117|nr:hypothetical protein [Vibrio sp. B1FIG11]CAD7826914.1 hypothetical protein ACOMICROBIO_LMKGKHOH_03943 [Vibrio sp. B1FIG11]CAE6962116.1 hypothetical protein ACOMICROBIO_LMKGKHOH_03943 [Vibrio sp. B1FIG11]
MLRKTYISLFLCFGLIPLANASEFDSLCTQGGGTLYKQQSISNFLITSANKNNGIYIQSNSGYQWRIANEFGHSIIFEEQLRIVRSSMIVGTKLNICAGFDTYSPRRVWALELTQ